MFDDRCVRGCGGGVEGHKKEICSYCQLTLDNWSVENSLTHLIVYNCHEITFV